MPSINLMKNDEQFLNYLLYVIRLTKITPYFRNKYTK